MRILPRSPRGNWLLATAAWLGACGLVWLFLPPQPRAEWPVHAPTSPIGFIPGTRTLVAGRVVAAWRDGGPTVGPVRSYDADTGRVVDWLAPDESVRQRTVVLSPDGKRATVRRGDVGHFSMQLFDPVAGRKIAELPLAEAGDVRAVSFSADGQLLAYAENGAGGGCVHVWDIGAGTERPRIGPSGDRLAFAPDGKSIAVADEAGPVGPAPIHVRVWDIASGKKLRDWEGPICGGGWHLQFSQDGQRLAVAFSRRDNDTFPNPGRTSGRNPWGFMTQVRGWDIAGGGELFRFGCDSNLFPPNQNWFATLTDPGWPRPAGTPKDTPWLVHDYAGAELASGFAAPTTYTFFSTGPDGRLHIVADVDQYSRFQPWVDSMHIRWRVPHTVSTTARFRDVRTGEEIGHLPTWTVDASENTGSPHWIEISPAEDVSAVEHDGFIRIWDIDPATPWGWFAAIAGLLALPILLAARWRIHRQARRVLSLF